MSAIIGGSFLVRIKAAASSQEISVVVLVVVVAGSLPPAGTDGMDVVGAPASGADVEAGTDGTVGADGVGSPP